MEEKEKKNTGLILICIVLVSLVLSIVYESIRSKDNPVQTDTTLTAQYNNNQEYQIFKDYQFKVKCPAILKDVSNRSNSDFDFNYAGSTDDTFYQIMIVKIPAGRLDLTREEEKECLIKMFENKGGGKSVLWGDDNYPAYLLNDYIQEGSRARGIAVARDGKIYVFNVITKADLDATFNNFTNNVKFLHNAENPKIENSDKTSIDTYSYSKYAVAVINYKESYQRVKKGYPFNEEEEIESYKLVWDISPVIEVSSDITEDDKQKLLDSRFEKKMVYIGKNILVDKELYLFNSYSEASKFMVEKRKLYYE